ncbi:hypothetical protein B7R74_19485 [Yersinia pseudotuberculosis]|nr:hypothetical protein B7R74_19485 [Yersinia pseudotuberculosis]
MRLFKCHSLYCCKAYVYVNNKGWGRPSPNKLIRKLIPYAIATGSYYIMVTCDNFVMKNYLFFGVALTLKLFR